MIKVDPTEPAEQAWQDWRTTANAAAREIKPKDKINSDLYKAGRSYLLRLFHGKCAYCESQIDADQKFGDVEHFRPKGQVTDANGKKVYVGQEPHPGYYWLAYDWHNLMPACIACNRPGVGPDATDAGKFDKFPVADETKRLTRPEDPPEQEEPLLLNPYFDDPADHLVFDPATGLVAPKEGSTKGAETIRILGLNREGLVELRKNIADAAGDDYVALLNARLSENEPEVNRRKQKCERYLRGEATYSAFGREAIRLRKKRILPDVV